MWETIHTLGSILRAEAGKAFEKDPVTCYVVTISVLALLCLAVLATGLIYRVEQLRSRDRREILKFVKALNGRGARNLRNAPIWHRLFGGRG
jgi:hypothetical protein